MTRWETRQLASICEVFADGDWIESKDQSETGVRLIQTGNVGEGVFKDRAEKARYISAETFQRLRCTAVVPGDCLISRLPDPVGRACIIPDTGESMITAVDCTIVRFRSGVYLPDFFAYYSQSHDYLSAVDAETTGTTRKRISRARLAQISVPAPPLAEQRRIVAILDEAFEAIATAKANAEKNLQNAQEIFDSALDTALSHHDQDCLATNLGSEVDLLAGYAFPSTGYTVAADGIRLLRGDNIMQGYLRWDDAKHWPADGAETYARFALKKGDVVLAMDRPWVKAGLKRAQIGASDLPCLQLQRTARLRPKRGMSVDFLYHLTGSRSFSQHLLNVQTGLGVPHISGKQIESFQFMLPSPCEQAAMTGKLDELQQRTERLDAVYRQKLAALDELKQSLLHQAFTGALTARATDQALAPVA